MRRHSQYRILAAAALVLVTASANATLITSDLDPLLSGASVVDFSEVPIGSTDPEIGPVRFVGELAQLETRDYGFFFHAEDNKPILANQTFSTDGTSFDMYFTVAIQAMGINAHGINSPVVLEAFDSNDQLLGTGDFPTNDRWGVFFLGFGDLAGSISRVRVNTTDSVMFDNLHFVPEGARIPLPATAALLILALAGLYRRASTGARRVSGHA